MVADMKWNDVCKFRVEQVDESNICQQTATNDFQAGIADQRTEGPSRVSVAFC